MMCCALWETLTRKIRKRTVQKYSSKYELGEKNDGGEMLIEFCQ